MNLIRLGLSAPGDGYRQLYGGPAEMALLTHPRLASLFDPAYEGYRTLNGSGSLLQVENVRQPGSFFQPRDSGALSLQATALVDDVQVLDKTGAALYNNWKDDYSYPAGDFTYFCTFRPNGSGNYYPLGTYDADGFSVGMGTDYKPRVYARHHTGSVMISSTADFADGRMDVVVAQYTYGDNKAKAWISGSLKIDATAAQAVNQTVRRLIVGSAYFTGTDPSGAANGKIGFAGVMAGAHPSFEPLIRAFAKERFPTALAHVA